VAECASGEDAISSIRTLQPDLAFLDIKMPGVSGLSVAREILSTNCLVVFITAYEAHALEAFDVRAFDYILKPIETARFETVIQRAHQAVRRMRLEQVVEAHKGVPTVASASSNTGEYHHRIRIRETNSLRYVDPGKVIWFEAANQYVKIHAVSGNYLISTESLNSLQDKVDPGTFVRVHRSSIVNVNHAIRIGVDGSGGYFIEMDNGDQVRVSRSNRGTLKDLDI
jgi:two-component system LytT family response regulator